MASHVMMSTESLVLVGNLAYIFSFECFPPLLLRPESLVRITRTDVIVHYAKIYLISYLKLYF